MATRGLFISFEGIDGAGKSTHVEHLASAFRAAGRTVVVTREPGGTPLAEQIRALVLSQPMDALTEALMMFAARRDHVCGVIAPALDRGEVVLCDRFTDATFAYQGAGRGFDWDTLSALERWVQHQGSSAASTGDTATVTPDIAPDLTLWLDLAPAAAAARRSGAGDRFEQLPTPFFDAVRAGYQRRATEYPQRFARIDAARTRGDVWRDIQDVVQRRGWL